MQTLTLGKHNPKLAELRRAIAEGTLTANGLLPIEGPKLIEEALRSGVPLTDIFVRKGTSVPTMPALVNTLGCIYEIEPSVFKTIQSTEASQGIITLVRPRDFDLQQMILAPEPLIVVLMRLQDPGNAGTILRIAESFHATGCIATSGTVSIYNPKTVRASAGSIFRVPHVWGVDANGALSRLRAAGISIIGSSPSGRQTIDTWNWRRPTAVLVGNEGGGLNQEESTMCDSILKIPHNPVVESLNSAISAAVILYDALKQRHSR